MTLAGQISRVFVFFTVIITVAFNLFLDSKSLTAQTVPINSVQSSQIELWRLLDVSDESFFFAQSPYSYSDYSSMLPTSEQVEKKWWLNPFFNSTIYDGNYLSVGIKPLLLQQTINTRFPISENNESAWYGRGFNHEFSGGLFISSKYITLTFSPHISHHENKDFLIPKRFFETNNPFISEIGGNIDAPIRFGENSFSTFHWGNSSVRVHYKNFETGIGTGTHWWGSSAKYPLILSNNAPGFKHFFLRTSRPFNIHRVGNIGFSWIMGYPEESVYFSGPSQGNTRFINAINFSYSPAFFPDFTVGGTRFFHLYEKEGLSLNNVMILFDPIRRSRLVQQRGDDEFREPNNQTASAYLHIRLRDSNAEIYAEFFREDHSYDFRDLYIQPHHNSAYSFGLQKLSDFPYFDFVKTHIDFTSLTSSQLNQVRPQAFFYSHDPISHGHTNRGQILGAAIGPGSNSQYISFKGYRNNIMTGISLQRIVRNDNLHFDIGSVSNSPAREFGDFFRHWVDLNLGLHFILFHKNVALKYDLMWTKAFNYGRFNTASFNTESFLDHEINDRYNIYLQIALHLRI